MLTLAHYQLLSLILDMQSARRATNLSLRTTEGSEAISFNYARMCFIND